MTMKKLLALLSIAIVLFSCTETDILDESGKMEVSDFNLPELPNGYFYEAWLLVDGSYVSVGKITNDSLNNNLARFDKIDASDLALAQAFAITVESASGAPSDFVLLTGEFIGNTADLNTTNTVPNGVQSLANRISGAFTVQNASVPPTEAGFFDVNGIWFFKGNDTKEATLKLDYRELVYQAWLIKNQANFNWNLNMGVIQSDSIADNWRNFIPQPYTAQIPQFPGEDFLQQPSVGTVYPEGFFPLDVRGAKVVITPILKNYNQTDIPFPIYLLEGQVPIDATKDAFQTYDLQINTTYKAKAKKL